MTAERRLEWAEIEARTADLARLMAPKGPWDGLIAVARGGLVPTALVARHLGIRLIDTLCLASYSGRTRGDLDVVKIPDQATSKGGAGWLVIDDLVDSGATAGKVRQILPRAHLAVLYAKPQGLPFADTHVETVAQETWLVFPWERSGE